MAQITTSKRWSLNLLDLLKGGITASIAASIALIYQLLEAWLTTPVFSMDKVQLMIVLKVAIGGFVGYILKNLGTQSSVKLTGADVDTVVPILEQAKAKVVEEAKAAETITTSPTQN